MLTIATRGPVSLVAGATDMRKAFNTLAAVASPRPPEGDLLVFCNRRKDRVKILVFERGGFWLCAKRLESGTFAWPEVATADLELSVQELTLLLGGIDLKSVVPRRGYRAAQRSSSRPPDVLSVGRSFARPWAVSAIPVSSATGREHALGVCSVTGPRLGVSS